MVMLDTERDVSIRPNPHKELSTVKEGTGERMANRDTVVVDGEMMMTMIGEFKDMARDMVKRDDNMEVVEVDGDINLT